MAIALGNSAPRFFGLGYHLSAEGYENKFKGARVLPVAVGLIRGFAEWGVGCGAR